MESVVDVEFALKINESEGPLKLQKEGIDFGLCGLYKNALKELCDPVIS